MGGGRRWQLSPLPRETSSGRAACPRPRRAELPAVSNGKEVATLTSLMSATVADNGQPRQVGNGSGCRQNGDLLPSMQAKSPRGVTKGTMMHHALPPEFIEYYSIRGATRIPYAHSGLSPATYLGFAQTDYLGKKDARTLVNTVTNARRALYYQLEGLAGALGWSLFASTNNIYAKLNFLRNCEVLSRTLAQRIVRLREIADRDYYIPTADEALEYLDLVEFTLGAVDKTATCFPDLVEADLLPDTEEYESTLALPEHFQLAFPIGAGRLTISQGGRTIVDVSVTDQEYFAWVSAVIKQNEASNS